MIDMSFTPGCKKCLCIQPVFIQFSNVEPAGISSGIFRSVVVGGAYNVRIGFRYQGKVFIDNGR